jgi:integrase
MPKRRGLTDKQIAALPRKEKRYTLPDPEQLGLYLRIPARGSRAPIAFAAVARNPNGKQIWQTVGTADAIGIGQARDKARDAIKQIRAGKPTGGADSVRAVAEQWLERVVRKNGFRTGREKHRIVNTYILPTLGDRPIADVRRVDIAHLLDRIEDDHGRAMADETLKTFGAISRWLQQRDEDYHPPLTAGMGRVPSGEGRRKRILSDAEIAAVWRVPGQFGDYVRLLLLTAQRREKLIQLRWDDIANDVWTIRTESREKGNAGRLKLPAVAMEIIQRQPRFTGNEFVFAGRNGPSAKFGAGQYKQAFDKLCGVSGWRVHDLRRAARSLMSRAGVQTEVAERVLGHAQGELIETYDRHDYQVEMADALERLAALVGQIVA